MGDPQYIINLMDQDSDHNCYFTVGDPTQGPVERIGVVSAMLMAHSMLLRRILSVQDTELQERWDFTLVDMHPKTFKNMLKFTYGFNNICTHTMTDTVELLTVAERLVMPPLMVEAGKHIIDLLTPDNICLALQKPVCLHFKMVTDEITKVIQNEMKKVLYSQNFHLICPAGLRYIVQLGDVRTSELDVWRAVMKWARRKVLCEEVPEPTNPVEAYVSPELIPPQRMHTRLCSLNVIQLVEEASSDAASREKISALLTDYHYVKVKPPRSMFVCVKSRDNQYITHEEFKVKVIHDCRLWMDKIMKFESELVINTGSSNVELFALVCTGKRMVTVNDEVAQVQKQRIDYYECKCTVKTFLIKSPERKKSDLISEINFKESVTVNEVFKIPLYENNEMLKLQPNSSYIIETRFSSLHPIWYTNDIDYFNPCGSVDLDVGGALINKANLWYGSHVRYVLFRTTSI